MDPCFHLSGPCTGRVTAPGRRLPPPNAASPRADTIHTVHSAVTDLLWAPERRLPHAAGIGALGLFVQVQIRRVGDMHGLSLCPRVVKSCPPRPQVVAGSTGRTWHGAGGRGPCCAPSQTGTERMLLVAGGQGRPSRWPWSCPLQSRPASHGGKTHTPQAQGWAEKGRCLVQAVKARGHSGGNSRVSGVHRAINFPKRHTPPPQVLHLALQVRD